MWVLKLNLLVFFSFSKQDNIFIQTDKIVEKKTVTLWCNVSFNDQEFISRMQWIQGEYIFGATNLEYINPLTTKRIDRYCLFSKIPKK